MYLFAERYWVKVVRRSGCRRFSLRYHAEDGTGSQAMRQGSGIFSGDAMSRWAAACFLWERRSFELFMRGNSPRNLNAFCRSRSGAWA